MYESTSQASPRFDANSASGIDVGFKGALDLLRTWRDGRTPDPELTVSRWADSHRLLSPRGANEAGRWRTSRTPYLREIMDALSPMHPAQRIVVMKGAQIGATEAGNNWIGYIIHHAPGPMLAVQPTVELAKRFSQQRLDPLIDESPVLREKVAPARSRDSGNTVLSKEFFRRHPGDDRRQLGGRPALDAGATSSTDGRTASRPVVEDVVDPIPATFGPADLRTPHERDPVTRVLRRKLVHDLEQVRRTRSAPRRGFRGGASSAHVLLSPCRDAENYLRPCSPSFCL